MEKETFLKLHNETEENDDKGEYEKIHAGCDDYFSTNNILNWMQWQRNR